MVRFSSIAASLAFAITVLAIPTPQEAAGDKNVGNGQGAQFITGACLSDADCASGCCAGLNGGAVCSAVLVASEDGKQGCGFGGADAGAGANNGSAGDAGAAAGGNNDAAGGAEDVAAGVDETLSGSQNVGKGDGSQFITGQCFSDADCASECCNKDTGLCNAPLAIGSENCGFQAAA